MSNHLRFLYNEGLLLWKVIFPEIPVLGPKDHYLADLEHRLHFIFHLMTWGISRALIYGLIVTQAYFVPWHPDGFLEPLLTYGNLPNFPRFPSLSVVPNWDFYNHLSNSPSPSLLTPLDLWANLDQKGNMSAASAHQSMGRRVFPVSAVTGETPEHLPA